MALGADLAGMAHPFLEPATESADRVAERIDRIVHELRVAMLCAGARTVADLRRTPIRRWPPLHTTQQIQERPSP